jgi:hypothetical protein
MHNVGGLGQGEVQVHLVPDGQAEAEETGVRVHPETDATFPEIYDDRLRQSQVAAANGRRDLDHFAMIPAGRRASDVQ